MELRFTSIEEMQEFNKRIKGTRGGKGGDADDSGVQGQQTGGQTAPSPLAPPVGGFPGPGAAAFSPSPGGAFPTTSMPTVPPEVATLVNRITTRIDFVIGSMGQSPEATLGWFRQQCGPEAANATLDQIKQVFLPKAAVPTLENIVKLIAA